MRLADRMRTKEFHPLFPKIREQEDDAAAEAHIAETLEYLGLDGDETDEILKAKLAARPDAALWVTERKAERERKLAELGREREAAIEKFKYTLGLLIEMGPVVVAQNVYQWMADTKNDTDIFDLPCLAPKWDVWWTEWHQANGQTIGVLATIKEDELFPQGEPLDVDTFEHETDDYLNGLVVYEKFWTSNHLPDVAAWENVRWVIQLQAFVGDNNEVSGPFIQWQLAVDAHGKLLDITWGSQTIDLDEDQVHSFFSIARVWGHALSFMNCRNVQTLYHEPSPGEQKKHRKKRRATSRLTGYHLIQIQPTGAAAQIRSGSAGGPTTDAFHIHPGSIAHYGDCCPGSHEPKGLLFGKLEGIYYRPMHVKGNPRHGTRTADYDIDAPR